MPVCKRCGTRIGLLSSLGFSHITNRCNVCDKAVADALREFRSEFVRFAADGVLSQDEWNYLRTHAAKHRFSLTEALVFVSNEAKQLIKRAVQITYEDGVVTQEEERYIEYLMALLQLPTDYAQTTRQIIRNYKEQESARTIKASEVSASAKKSAYEVLGVSTGATSEEVGHAYHRMAKLYHPDKVASLAPEFKILAETRMREINSAYQSLAGR